VRITRAAIVSLMTLALWSCSAPVEEPLLTQFFAASRLRDLTALQTIASVVFEPSVQGVVTGFDITRVVSRVEPDGDRESREVSISAPVRLPDGRTQRKNYIVMIRRARSSGNTNHRGGWMITAIRDGVESPSTPPS
jgi:hypothetical protein